MAGRVNRICELSTRRILLLIGGGRAPVDVWNRKRVFVGKKCGVNYWPKSPSSAGKSAVEIGSADSEICSDKRTDRREF